MLNQLLLLFFQIVMNIVLHLIFREFLLFHTYLREIFIIIYIRQVGLRSNWLSKNWKYQSRISLLVTNYVQEFPCIYNIF